MTFAVRPRRAFFNSSVLRLSGVLPGPGKHPDGPPGVGSGRVSDGHCILTGPGAWEVFGVEILTRVPEC